MRHKQKRGPKKGWTEVGKVTNVAGPSLPDESAEVSDTVTKPRESSESSLELRDDSGALFPKLSDLRKLVIQGRDKHAAKPDPEYLFEAADDVDLIQDTPVSIQNPEIVADATTGKTTALRNAKTKMRLPRPSNRDRGVIKQLKLWVRRPADNEAVLKQLLRMQHPEFDFAWDDYETGSWENVPDYTLMSLYCGIKNSVTHVFKSTCGVCGTNSTDTERMRIVSSCGTRQYMLNKMFPDLAAPEESQMFSVCATCFRDSRAFEHCSPHGDPETEDVTTPGPLAAIKNPLHEQMLSLGRVYSCVYKHTDPRRVQFQHLQGDLQYGKHLEGYFQGMLGALSVRNATPVVNMPHSVIEGVKWLRRHNVVFQQFASLAETLWPWLLSTPQCPNGGDIPVGDGTVADQMDQEDMALIELDLSYDETPRTDKNHDTVGRTFPREDAGASLEKLTKLSFSDPLFDAKTFPRLFPYGRGGHDYREKQLTLTQWQKKKLLHLSDVFRLNKTFIFVQLDRKTKTSLFSANRFFLSNRKKTEMAAPDLESQQSADNSKTPYGTELPPNLQGSAAYWASCTGDVIAISDPQYLGQPDLFGTLTQNDLWSEIEMSRKTAPGHSPSDTDEVNPTEPSVSVNCPIEVTLAYNKRWLEFKRLFLHNPAGPFGPVRHYWFRHEYQKRGAIHTHLVIWLKNRNSVDRLISAHIPRESTPLADLLRKLVLRYQIHERCLKERCYKGVGGKTLKECKYGFPYHTPHLTCCLDEKKVRYLYARYDAEDAKVVPYNPDLLLFWQGHSNLQKVTANGWQLYLAKYVAKAEPKLRLRTTFNNEVEKYLTTKITGVLEACQRLLSTSLHGSTVDTIYLQDEIIPTYQFIKKGHPKNVKPTDADFCKTKFQKYLSKPAALMGITYSDFYQYFVATSKAERVTVLTQDETPGENLDANPDALIDTGFWNATTESSRHIIARFRPGQTVGGDGETKVMRRRKPVVTRFRFSVPDANGGEPYYQQLLLRKCPFHGEDSWFSADNESRTFLEECIIRNLVDENTIHEVIDKAVSKGLSYESIREIASMCLRSFPELTDAVGESLAQVQELYEQSHFAYTTEEVDETPEIFPEPPAYEAVEMTERQKEICKELVDKVTAGGEAGFISMLGPAGTGKSVVIREVHRVLAERNVNVCVLASTGTAACNVGGTTVHNYFGLGIDNRAKTERDTVEFWRAHLIDLVIIDEISMLCSEALAAVSDLLKMFNKRNQRMRMFGGVSIFLVGDPAQLPPVSKDGKNHSVFLSKFWRKFKVLYLSDVLRQPDPRFQRVLTHLRYGSFVPEVAEILATRIVTVDCIVLDKSKFVPIVCAHIETTHEWNAKYLALLDEKGDDFNARDFGTDGQPMSEVDKARVERWCHDRLPDKLTIKKGATVMLLRNIDVKNGWHNGALATVKEYSNRVITIQSIKTGRILMVPRYRNSYKIFNSPALGYREQFPLQLAYAVTIHKFQGQTLDTVIVDLRRPCWESGQCYTAISRVRTLQGLTIIGEVAPSVMIDQWVLDLLPTPDSGIKPMIAQKRTKRSATHTEISPTSTPKRAKTLSNQTYEEKGLDQCTGIPLPRPNLFADNHWWKERLQLSKQDRIECLAGEELATTVVDAAIFLLRKRNRVRQLAGQTLLSGLDYISSLQDDTHSSNFHTGIEALQILFVNGGHYQVLHRKGQQLFIYDTIPSSRTDPQNLLHIKAYMKQNHPKHVIYVPVQQQLLPDCACFATAFAFTVLQNEDPSSKVFSRDQLRTHFIYCLDNEKLERFPEQIVDHLPKTPNRLQLLTPGNDCVT